MLSPQVVGSRMPGSTVPAVVSSKRLSAYRTASPPNSAPANGAVLGATAGSEPNVALYVVGPSVGLGCRRDAPPPGRQRSVRGGECRRGAKGKRRNRWCSSAGWWGAWNRPVGAATPEPSPSLVRHEGGSASVPVGEAVGFGMRRVHSVRSVWGGRPVRWPWMLLNF